MFSLRQHPEHSVDELVAQLLPWIHYCYSILPPLIIHVFIFDAATNTTLRSRHHRQLPEPLSRRPDHLLIWVRGQRSFPRRTAGAPDHTGAAAFIPGGNPTRATF